MWIVILLLFSLISSSEAEPGVLSYIFSQAGLSPIYQKNLCFSKSQNEIVVDIMKEGVSHKDISTIVLSALMKKCDVPLERTMDWFNQALSEDWRESHGVMNVFPSRPVNQLLAEHFRRKKEHYIKRGDLELPSENTKLSPREADLYIKRLAENFKKTHEKTCEINAETLGGDFQSPELPINNGFKSTDVDYVFLLAGGTATFKYTISDEMVKIMKKMFAQECTSKNIDAFIPIGGIGEVILESLIKHCGSELDKQSFSEKALGLRYDRGIPDVSMSWLNFKLVLEKLVIDSVLNGGNEVQGEECDRVYWIDMFYEYMDGNWLKCDERLGKD